MTMSEAAARRIMGDRADNETALRFVVARNGMLPAMNSERENRELEAARVLLAALRKRRKAAKG